MRLSRTNFLTSTALLLCVVALGGCDLGLPLLSNNAPAGSSKPRPPAQTTAPVITSVAPTSAVVSIAFTYTITATGTPAPTFSVSGNPGWLTFSGVTLSGTPTAGDIGMTGMITVTASNGIEPVDMQDFTITVVDSSQVQAPQITSTAVASAQVGSLYSYTIVTTGTPTPTLSVSGNPAWLTLSGNTLTGTPAVGDVGTTGTITVTAANGVSLDAMQSFTVTVTNNTTAPQITSSAPTTAVVGMLYSHTILVTGVPAPSLSVSGNPAWLALSGVVLSGTPAAGDIGTTGIITITAINGVSPDATQAFTITVTDVGTPPQILSVPPATAVAGMLLSHTIVTMGNPTPAISVSGIPAWLSLSGNELSGTPSVGDIGATGTITIRASNGIAPDVTQEFWVDVLSSGTAPEITSTPAATGIVGSLYIYTIAGTGSPTPTYSVSGNPAWLTLSGNVLLGTPSTGDSTTGLITLTASNGIGPNAIQTFGIRVSMVPTSSTYFGVPVSGKVVFVFDRSGSMIGQDSGLGPIEDWHGNVVANPTRLQVLQSETAAAMRGLHSADQYAVVTFGDRPEWTWYAQLVRIDEILQGQTSLEASVQQIIDAEAYGQSPSYTALHKACTVYGDSLDTLFFVCDGNFSSNDSQATGGAFTPDKLLQDFAGWFATLRANGCKLVCVYMGNPTDSTYGASIQCMQDLATQNGGLFISYQ